MKRFMFVLALLLVVGLSSALAQSEAEALVTASVESELVLVNVDGDWGLFSPGQTYTVTPSGFKEPPGPGEGAGIVVDAIGFEIDGNPGSDVLVSLILPGAFNSDDENGNLPLSNWTYGWNYDNDPGVAFADAGPVTGSAVTGHDRRRRGQRSVPRRDGDGSDDGVRGRLHCPDHRLGHLHRQLSSRPAAVASPAAGGGFIPPGGGAPMTEGSSKGDYGALTAVIP